MACLDAHLYEIEYTNAPPSIVFCLIKTLKRQNALFAGPAEEKYLGRASNYFGGPPYRH
jgi:hypothetical protein